VRTPARWPLHPPPRELEALSSWLARLARIYEIPVGDLLSPNLGVLTAIPDFIDEEPPAEIFTALSERTGVPAGQVRAMTLPGWVPWLLDSYPVTEHTAQETFATYVRQDSVLLARGVAPQHRLTYRSRRWRGPWIPATALHRSCPVCTADPAPYRGLMWRLPLTLGCTVHRCRLIGDAAAFAAGPADPSTLPVPIEEPQATMDNYTHQALTTGRVELPGRPVHAGVWFRLLRCLLDELSLAPSTLGRHSARILEQVWAETGCPARGRIKVWRPYENLPWETQEKLLSAAGVALRLAAERRIDPRGTLAGLLAEPRPIPVHDGDDPRVGYTEDGIAAAVRAVERGIRADRDTAQQMLSVLVGSDPSPADVGFWRARMISELAVPPEFLDPPELPWACLTAAQTEALLLAEGYERTEVRRVITEYAAERLLRADVTFGEAGYLFRSDDRGQLRARLDL
jgi:hypothetical protein